MASSTVVRNVLSFGRCLPWRLLQIRGYATSFTLTEEQLEIQSLTRKYVRDCVIPVAAANDQSGKFPRDLIEKAWELGILTGHIPNKLGGPGLDLLTNCLIAEEIGYGCAALMITIETSSLGQSALLNYGNSAQQKKYLCRLIEDPLLTAFCITEPDAGSDVAAASTRAVKKGDEYVINGQKAWITNAGVANWYLVLARTSLDPQTSPAKAFSAFIIDRDSPGVSVGKKELNMGQRAADTRSIKFEDVRVPKENLIMGEGAGFKITMSTFDKTRPLVSAGAVGLSRRCLDESVKYSMERKTFGAPLYNYQAIAFMLADMAMGIELGRLIYQKAAWENDRGIRNSYNASIAKCFNADMAVKISSDAVQIFGGNGYNSEYPVEKLMRDSKALQIYGGTSQIQRLIIAKTIINNAK